jgi:lipopolysaccharide biosynthesis regulator YciM
MAAWEELLAVNAPHFGIVAVRYASSALASGASERAAAVLAPLYERMPTIDLLTALNALDTDSASRERRAAEHLRRQPSLAAAKALLSADRPPSGETLPALRDTVAKAAAPLQRYRCAACGFESQQHFWQCPGCLTWDSFPPRRLEDL